MNLWEEMGIIALNTENPRVGGSIPPLGTKEFKGLQSIDGKPFLLGSHWGHAVENLRKTLILMNKDSFPFTASKVVHTLISVRLIPYKSELRLPFEGEVTPFIWHINNLASASPRFSFPLALQPSVA